MKKIIQTLQQPVDRKELNKTLENSQKDNDFIIYSKLKLRKT